MESRAAKSDDPAVSVASILFPVGGGPRLSTIVAISLFLTLAIAWEEKRPVLACLAWLFSFEVAFQVTSLAFGHHVEFLLLGLGLVLVPPWLTRRGAKPSLSLLAVALVLFAAWIAAGFHVNVNAHGMMGFDPAAEALNEATKTLWAVAYLVPLLRSPGWRGLSREPPPGVWMPRVSQGTQKRQILTRNAEWVGSPALTLSALTRPPASQSSAASWSGVMIE